MYASLLFWLALALPGYVLVRWLAPGQCRSGLLGVLSISYLAALGLLSPISILCYALHAPLSVFSGACIAAVLAGMFEITRRGWWTDAGRLLLSAVSVELLIIVLDMIAGARGGAILDADARVHLACIRRIVDGGFSNCDPFIAPCYFFPVYHTNILHSLYAACTQITGIDHLGVWFASLPWAKLLAASGIYYLTWSVFDRRWPAILAAVTIVAVTGPLTFLVYPNKLAPLWLMPCMLGIAIHTVGRPVRWGHAGALAVGSLVIGQVHGLYVIFAALLIVPPLAGRALWKGLKHRPDRWAAAACLLALAAGLPFPVITRARMMERASDVSAQDPSKDVAGPFTRLNNGWVMHELPQGAASQAWRWGLLAAACVLPLLTDRRRYAAFVIAAELTVFVCLYTPPVCTAFLALFKAEWVLARLGAFLRIGAVVLIIPSTAYLLERRLARWWTRPIIAAAVFAGVALTVYQKPPYTWTQYRSRALAPANERYAVLRMYRSIRGILERHVPPGETILVKQSAGMGLVSLYDCHVAAAETSNNAVPDIEQRRSDLKAMLVPSTPWPLRRQLLKKYRIRYFIPHPATGVWAPPHTKRRMIQNGFELLELDAD